MPPARIIVFGSVGEGKSSLINLLAGEKVQRVGADVLGVTFQSSYCSVKSPKGEEYTFVDTVGLDESNAGKVNGLQALLALKQLLTDASSQGFALALMVHKGARLTTASFDANYRVFVENLFVPAGVPVVLVKTGLDQEDDWEAEWYCAETEDGRKNKDVISELYPGFKRVFGGTCQADINPRIAAFVNEQRDKTCEGLWRVIEETKLTANSTIPHGKVREFFITMWNSLCDGMMILSEASATLKKCFNGGPCVTPVCDTVSTFWKLAKVHAGKGLNFVEFCKNVMTAGQKAGLAWWASKGGTTDSPEKVIGLLNAWWGAQTVRG